MGFFALLSYPGAGEYTVEACHLNVWSLSGLFPGHRPMLFDVGVRLRATDKVTEVEMALPIGAGRLTDLSEVVKNEDRARLIFGKDLEHTGEILRLHSIPEEILVRAVREDDNPRGPDSQGRHLSVVRVQLTEPVPAGKQAYFRARFVADRVGDLWRWRRVAGRRNGALIDFRSPDPREGGAGGHHAHLTARALPMALLDAFFMLPDRFQLASAEPELDYIRTLEGHQWSPYLRRAPYLKPSRERLIVYRWHGKKVSRGDVFRGFMQFNRQPPSRPLTDHLLQGAIVAGLLYAALRPLSLRHGLVDAGNSISDTLWSVGGAIVGVLGVIGVTVLAVIAKVRKAGRTFAAAKRWFKRYVEYPFVKFFA